MLIALKQVLKRNIYLDFKKTQDYPTYFLMIDNGRFFSFLTLLKVRTSQNPSSLVKLANELLLH